MGRNKFQNISTILFDLDNTLINTKEADRLACEEVHKLLQTYNVRRSTAKEVVKKFYDYVKETPQDLANADVDTGRIVLWKQALGPKLANFATTAYHIWKETKIKHIKFTSEIEELLLELRKHYKLGLLTIGSISGQWEKINKVNGQAYFDAIVVGDDTMQSKLDLSMFEEVFRKLDVSSLECVMVGDDLLTDIKGGVKSNCAITVLVSSCSNEDGHLRPDFKIEHVRDLVSLLPDKRSFSSLCSQKSVGLFHSLREEPLVTWRRRVDL